jgi:chromosome segregation ATPase
MLEAQIRNLKGQTQKHKENESEYGRDHFNEAQELNKKVKEAASTCKSFEDEKRKLTAQHTEAANINHSNRLNKMQTEADELEKKLRYEQEHALLTAKIEEMKKEDANVDDGLAKIRKAFDDHKEYQEKLAKIAEYKKQIDNDRIEHDYLKI